MLWGDNMKKAGKGMLTAPPRRMLCESIWSAQAGFDAGFGYFTMATMSQMMAASAIAA